MEAPAPVEVDDKKLVFEFDRRWSHYLKNGKAIIGESVGGKEALCGFIFPKHWTVVSEAPKDRPVCPLCKAEHDRLYGGKQ